MKKCWGGIPLSACLTAPLANLTHLGGLMPDHAAVFDLSAARGAHGTLPAEPYAYGARRRPLLYDGQPFAGLHALIFSKSGAAIPLFVFRAVRAGSVCLCRDVTPRKEI